MPYESPPLIADRKHINTYIAQDNPGAAIELGDMLMQKAAQLDQGPAQGVLGA